MNPTTYCSRMIFPRFATGRSGLVACLALAWLACSEPAAEAEAPKAEPAPPTAVASTAGAGAWVGSAVCAECHAEEAAAWTGSHHDLAMQEPSAESVVGDFDDARFEVGGTTWRFVTYQGKYLIQSEGAESGEYEVAYTFGADPLQQYLIAFPDGRLQALHVAWDSRPSSEGGQRWFSLPGDRPAPVGDVMHWQGPGANWNSLCADCHSTQVRKNFDLAKLHYDSSWEEIDVGCEACHGSGGAHVRWAQGRRQGSSVASRLHVAYPPPTQWVRDAGEPIAHAMKPVDPDAEIDTCAPCHSRRRRLVESPRPEDPFLDGFQPVALDPGVYHDDGQILEEVYVWGSYVQSRMHRAGVRCSDCHDPHTTKLKAEGNALCGQCHAPDVFDTRAHHHHEGDTEAAQCTTCHMPSRVYMQIDERHDHRFSVPRPEQSAAIGTPHVCARCHEDRPDPWAAEQLTAWRGDPEERTHFGRRLAMRRVDGLRSARELQSLVEDTAEPGIARATALLTLAAGPPPSLIAAAADSPDGLLRHAAAVAGGGLPPESRGPALAKLLDDRLHSVRIEAARTLIDVSAEELTTEQRNARRREIQAYRASQDVHPDDPAAHTNLAALHLRENRDWASAEAALRSAIRVGPHFLPAYLSLSDLLGQSGRDEEGQKLLEQALEVAPDAAHVHLALGLLHARQQREEKALEYLRRARELAPSDPQMVYVQAVALHSNGRSRDALELLKEALVQLPESAILLQLYATMARDEGDFDAALQAARRLEELYPQQAEPQQLVRDIERRAAVR